MPGSHTAQSHTGAFLMGVEYSMWLPNLKSPCPTWLDLMCNTVLWRRTFKTMLVLLYPLLKLLPDFLSRSRGRIILCHLIPLYRTHITASALSRSLYYLTLILMEIICLKDLICECELNFFAAFAVQHLQIMMTFDPASLVRILTTLSKS